MPTLSFHREWRFSVALATVLVLLAAGGCKRVSAGRPKLLPEKTPPGLWSEQQIQKGWITVTVGLPHRGEPPYPVVMSPIVPAHTLLERGIGIVRWKTNWAALSAIEPSGSAKSRETPRPGKARARPRAEKAGGGATVGLWLLREDRAGIVGRTYFRLITNEATRSVPGVLDYLQTRSDIDSDRIAITGSSTGGFTALQALASEPRLAAAAVRVTCGDYRIFLQSSSLALDDQDRWLVDGRMMLDPAYDAEIEAIEPLSHADALPPRPLLLVTGSDDRAIPAACVEATAEAFDEAYQRADVPGRFEWVEFEGQGHNLDEAAELLVLAFLEKWLAGPPSARAR